MAKIRKIFVCSVCGTQSAKWMGRCPGCEGWNTFQEEVVYRESEREKQRETWRGNQRDSLAEVQAVPLPEVQAGERVRLKLPDTELQRVLGGGLVPGSLVLVGGEPGIGKSTLMLQMAMSLEERVLYVSGEESASQIKMRADRIGLVNPDCYLLTQTNTTQILQQARKLEPAFLIVDSIQTLRSPLLDSLPGSVTQIRESAGELQRFAKETGIPVVLIGHINKEGQLAGPKLLEHVVDTVLSFEGDRNHAYRILRSLKNRFGSTDELGIYEMRGSGLRPVSNPSELLIAQTDEQLSGSAIAATVEGLRPMLIETQALVSTAVYGTPQRSATGFDLRRLHMLLAVLEKRGKFPLGQYDVFLNMAGGIRVQDPGIDLAVISSLLSSFHDIALPYHSCFAGEVGLSGEIRAVHRIEQRIQEADRLGFKLFYLPRSNMKGLDSSRYAIELKPMGKVEELYHELFEL